MDDQTGISQDYLPMDPKRLIERLHTALNTRDLTNLLHLLQVDFEQTRPNQPDWMKIGLEAVREEWGSIFERYPRFSADLLEHTIDGSTIWTEWRWYGDRDAGQAGSLEQAGVILFGVRDNLLAWSRSYMLDVNPQ